MNHSIPCFADSVKNFSIDCGAYLEGSWAELNRHDRVRMVERCGYIIEVMARRISEIQEQGLLGPVNESLKVVKFKGRANASSDLQSEAGNHGAINT
jgi:hypothetical protein